jgi:hypothetical protein
VASHSQNWGKAVSIANVIENPLKNPNDNTSTVSTLGGDAGLQLWVRAPPAGETSGLVSTAEVDARRLDMFYGSYRASMKLSSVSGTCGAFFWVGSGFCYHFASAAQA